MTDRRRAFSFDFVAINWLGQAEGWLVLSLSILTAAAQGPGSPDKPPFQLPTPIRVLYSFSAATNFGLGYANAEGASCMASLVQGGDGRLYGVAPSGGGFGSGTVFGLNTNGGGLMVLHTFSVLAWRAGMSNEDGANPTGLLRGMDGSLYGTGSQGGTNGSGALFKVNLDGSGFTNLHNFAETDGANPQGGMVQGP